MVDRLAAVVGDNVITLTEIYDLAGEHISEQVALALPREAEDVRRQLELDVLDALVARRLVEMEMGRLGLDVTDADVDRALTDIAQQNGIQRSTLRAEVEASGLHWDSYMEELTSSLREMKFTQQVLASRITVRDDEIEDAWRRNKASAADSPSVEVLGMLLLFPKGADDTARGEVLDLARALADRVSAGEDFGAIAQEHSAEPYASRMGQMGTFQRGDLVGDLDSALFNTEPGSVAAPVETPQGVFILKPVAWIEPPAPPLEEVREVISQQLMQQKLEAAREQWVAQARRSTAVKILLEPTGGEPE